MLVRVFVPVRIFSLVSKTADAHPIEEALGNQLPAILGPALLGAHNHV